MPITIKELKVTATVLRSDRQGRIPDDELLARLKREVLAELRREARRGGSIKGKKRQ
ncbi:MAG: hypothetical protein LIO85_05705 [Rikenellaceae bacterium]|nr:hypothetical protein [Rikenellaceae bacterium]